MAARRKAKKFEYPPHIVTQAKAAAGILGVTPIFGDEDYMMKSREYGRLLTKYESEKCEKCKKKTPNLGLKDRQWLCRDCFTGPKPYINNEE